MLMFSKTSIPSFVYDPIDVLIFPDEDVKEIYENIWNWKMLLVSEFNRHKQYFSIFFLFANFHVQSMKKSKRSNQKF